MGGQFAIDRLGRGPERGPRRGLECQGLKRSGVKGLVGDRAIVLPVGLPVEQIMNRFCPQRKWRICEGIPVLSGGFPGAPLVTYDKRTRTSRVHASDTCRPRARSS